MMLNLNSLSLEEIQELEKYVRTKLPDKYRDFKTLFTDLKSGKLKNKNIEVDSLDFIYDGLSETVENWFKQREKDSNSEMNNLGKLEKIICAPTTRVGKFLREDVRKQITLEQGIKKLKQEGKLSNLLNRIADLKTRTGLFEFVSHDLEHTMRVLVNSDMIMSLNGNVSQRERDVILKAIELHDTGRIHDFEDNIHGERAVANITNELDDFSKEEQELIKFIIIQHCKSNGENEVAISALNKSEKEKNKYRKTLNVMKDADKLDRVRFPEVHPLVTDLLDPNRLKTEEAKTLIKFACELFEKSDKLFGLKNDKTLDSLFKRTSKFAEQETGKELAESVRKVLAENGYPERSKNLKITELKPQDEKFIKDGYIYLFRGSRKGQSSGFYAHPYAKEKVSVEQYLKKHPDATAYGLAKRQSMRGKERFISATTDLWIALGFTKFSKAKPNEGSIYIIKMKPEDAYRVKNQIQCIMPSIGKIDEKDGIEDESEYLIPDYVEPKEIIKEFDCKDFSGIYDYLKHEVGLDITLEDLNIKKQWLENPEMLDDILEDICRRNEFINSAAGWNNSSDRRNAEADFGFEIIQELMKNPQGEKMLKKIIENMMNGKMPNITDIEL